jgi:anti-anti-sigma factor
VQFLSSAALRVLLLFDRRLHAKNGVLRLANISDKILEVFQITRLDKYFEIYPTLLEARGSFGD